jgi:hypothetical protein
MINSFLQATYLDYLIDKKINMGGTADFFVPLSIIYIQRDFIYIFIIYFGGKDYGKNYDKRFK